MDDPKADIMMYFLMEGGAAVYAESSLEVDSSDPFMAGFRAASKASDYSNFFEVTQFSFSLKTVPSEGEGGNLSNKAAGVASGAVSKVPPKVDPTKPGAKGAADQYERWRSATAEQLKTMKYPIEFGTFSFSRSIDAASPIFFQNCTNQISFQEAVLVKRLQAQTGSNVKSEAFLRVKFTDVLLTKVAWEDGDIVKESCTFKCKKMDVQYKRQSMDGTLSGTVAQSSWDQQLNGKPPSAAGSGGAT